MKINEELELRMKIEELIKEYLDKKARELIHGYLAKELKDFTYNDEKISEILIDNIFYGIMNYVDSFFGVTKESIRNFLHGECD